ncbi:MAG: ABC transporter permease subunit [Coriobacteriales bacterium]|jgi:putative spermidine/putrescine transport system permease protein|nr:ABC transporter permease subunit [Coriobacteriales bacterium]
MRSRLSLIGSFLPLALLMALAYLWPVLVTVQASFADDAGVFVGAQNYEDTLTSYYFIDSLLFSLKVSLVSTLVSMILAVVLALALRETFVGKKLALFICQYNLSVPRMAAAMIMVFLISQTGWLSSLAHEMGIYDSAAQFPFWVYDAGGVGLITVFVWKFTPYICMSVLGILQGASLEYEHQAATLGIGRVKRFVHVVLPSIIPATAVASILVFAASFGDYEVPAILGSAQSRPLSVMVYLKYLDPHLRDRPEAFVIMVIMTLVLMAIIVTYWLCATRSERNAS